MVGTRVFNQKKAIDLPKNYSCSTTGDNWIFLELSDNLYIDTRKYYLNEVAELLGVFQHIIDYYKSQIN